MKKTKTDKNNGRYEELMKVIIEQGIRFEQQGARLDQQGSRQDVLAKKLDEVVTILNEHTVTLKEHSKILSTILQEIYKTEKVIQRFKGLE